MRCDTIQVLSTKERQVQDRRARYSSQGRHLGAPQIEGGEPAVITIAFFGGGPPDESAVETIVTSSWAALKSMHGPP